MASRALAVLLVSLSAALSSPAFAEAPAIDHDPVGCIVAGQYPKLDACFTPFENLASARVYFKAVNGPSWYWVAFARNQAPKPHACYSAILPKPTRKIEGMLYYVEAADKQFEVGRDPEHAVRIVKKKEECGKDIPVAGMLPKASVVVGSAAGAPVVPLGFAAGSGLGAAVIAPVVIGGTGVSVAGAKLLSKDSPTATATATATPVPTRTPTPVPTVAPQATPISFNPVVLVSPTAGPEPLVVTFDACGSQGQALRYSFDYNGDGIADFTSDCHTTATYTVAGVTGHRGIRAQNVAGADYDAVVVVREDIPGGGFSRKIVHIHVDASATPTATATPTPAATATPAATPTATPTPVPFAPSVSANPLFGCGDGPPTPVTFDGCSSTGQNLKFAFDFDGNGVDDLVTDTTGCSQVANYSWTDVSWNGGSAPAKTVPEQDIWTPQVTVFENVAGGGSKAFPFTVNLSCQGAPGSGTNSVAHPRRATAPGSGPRIVGSTQVFGVEGVRLLLNEALALSAPSGGSSFASAGRVGVNRLELRSSGNHAGTVAFDLSSTPKLVAGSLRVLTGNPVALGDRQLVFRLSGTPGESASFAFEIAP
jgi:hypothetical protein